MLHYATLQLYAPKPVAIAPIVEFIERDTLPHEAARLALSFGAAAAAAAVVGSVVVVVGNSLRTATISSDGE